LTATDVSLGMMSAPEWIQPGGINRLATCLTQQAHGRFSAIRMEEGYLGLMRTFIRNIGAHTLDATVSGLQILVIYLK
jgi:hypothetical protein